MTATVEARPSWVSWGDHSHLAFAGAATTLCGRKIYGHARREYDSRRCQECHQKWRDLDRSPHLCRHTDYSTKAPYRECGKPANGWLGCWRYDDRCREHRQEVVARLDDPLSLLVMYIREVVYRIRWNPSWLEGEPGLPENVHLETCPLCHGSGIIMVH